MIGDSMELVARSPTMATRISKAEIPKKILGLT